MADEKIPKIIHYCWFGGKPLPKDVQRNIETWKENCPDYQIMRWDESSFDLDSNAYTKEAYEAKKWAFITDYVRLFALYTYGGIYMDTDVEVLKPLDLFLQEPGFSGFERKNAVPTGIMGAKKGNAFIELLLTDYVDRHFKKSDGQLDLTTNVKLITQKAVQCGLKLNNKKQMVKDFVFYPTDYFCPKDYRTLELNITPNTYTIHHFNGSWNTQKTLRSSIKSKMPKFCLKFISKIMDNIDWL